MIFKFFEMHLYGTHIMCIAIRQPKTLPDSKAFTYHSLLQCIHLEQSLHCLLTVVVFLCSNKYVSHTHVIVFTGMQSWYSMDWFAVWCLVYCLDGVCLKAQQDASLWMYVCMWVRVSVYAFPFRACLAVLFAWGNEFLEVRLHVFFILLKHDYYICAQATETVLCNACIWQNLCVK